MFVFYFFLIDRKANVNPIVSKERLNDVGKFRVNGPIQKTLLFLI